MYSRQAQARGLEILSTTNPTLRVEALHAQIEEYWDPDFLPPANSGFTQGERKTKSTMDCHHVLVPFHRLVVSLRALCPQLLFTDAEVLSKGERYSVNTKSSTGLPEGTDFIGTKRENSIPKGVVKTMEILVESY